MNNEFLKYCKLCLIPETRPNTFIDAEGICSGCRNFKNRDKTDWDKRRSVLIETIDKNRSKDGSNYDCIIPCSGGKDSTYQVIKIKELGFNPLCITVTPCDVTGIGRKNIENIKNLGVDYSEITTNPIVRKRLNKYCLNLVGDISWPESVSIWCNIARLSIKHKIPLIVWGENPENENGGPEKNSDVLDDVQRHDHRWMEEFGGTLGLRASDILYDLRDEGFKEIDMIPYTYPDKNEIKKNGTIGIFLGYYLPWDGHANYLVAKSKGFKEYHKNVEGSIVPYENLDNYQKRIHDYFKYLKYGYDRVSDWGSLAIRRKRMTREEGIELTKEIGGKFPSDYLGKSLKEILNKIDVTVDEFIEVCDKFTNKKIFQKNSDGSLKRDNNDCIFKNNYDNIKK